MIAGIFGWGCGHRDRHKRSYGESFGPPGEDDVARLGDVVPGNNVLLTSEHGNI